jgi:hypothetical protein
MNIREIKAHGWIGLGEQDWIQLEKQRVPPPFIPDTSYTRTNIIAADAEKIVAVHRLSHAITTAEQELFKWYIYIIAC